MSNQYKGFDLFNDIEDAALRTRNRAVVLGNMAEAHTKNRKINVAGAGLILGYFNQIPMEERAGVQEAFVETMKKNHYVLAN